MASRYTVCTLIGERSVDLFKRFLAHNKASFDALGSRLQVFEDGTLSETSKEDIRGLEVDLIDFEKSNKELDEILSQHPNCRYFKNAMPMGKKLFFLLAYFKPPLLYLDSDVFFTQRADLEVMFRNFLQSGFEVCGMEDYKDSYCFGSNLRAAKFLQTYRKPNGGRAHYAENVNAGFCLRRDHNRLPEILDFIESVLDHPIYKEAYDQKNARWYMEQTMFMLLGNVEKFGLIDPAKAKLGTYIERERLTEHALIHFVGDCRDKIDALPAYADQPEGPAQFDFVSPKRLSPQGLILRSIAFKIKRAMGMKVD